VPFLTGGQIFAAWLALSLLFTCLGLWIWLARASYQVSNATSNALRALAVITMCGLFFSIKGIWVLGVVFLALTILLAVAFLRFLNPV
jgi:hypothetical protein